MNAAELITQAADLIETTGWTQGYEFIGPFANDERAVCFCAHGALSVADKFSYSQAYYDATCALDERTEDAPYTGSKSDHAFVRFNDTPGRTKEEVLALMRATAKELSV